MSNTLTLGFDATQKLATSSLSDLADANSRYTYYEAIREEHDPTSRHRAVSVKLNDADYLINAPVQTNFLTQLRLNTLKSKIAQASQEQAKQKEMEEKRAKFEAGLLG